MKREIIYNKHGLCVTTDGNHTNITKRWFWQRRR